MARIVSSRSTAPRKAPQKLQTKPRKQAIQERSQATVEHILRATARILVRDGYDVLSTNRVARAAGVSVGSLYQYFPNKESLAAALVNRHVEEMKRIIRDEAPKAFPLPLADAVRRFVEIMVDAHRVDPKLHRVLVEQLPRVGDLAELESVHDAGAELVRAYLLAHAEEVRPCDAEVASFIVATAIEAVTHGAVLTRPDLLQKRALVDETTELIVRYLRR